MLSSKLLVFRMLVRIRVAKTLPGMLFAAILLAPLAAVAQSCAALPVQYSQYPSDYCYCPTKTCVHETWYPSCHDYDNYGNCTWEIEVSVCDTWGFTECRSRPPVLSISVPDPFCSYNGGGRQPALAGVRSIFSPAAPGFPANPGSRDVVNLSVNPPGGASAQWVSNHSFALGVGWDMVPGVYALTVNGRTYDGIAATPVTANWTIPRLNSPCPGVTPPACGPGTSLCGGNCVSNDNPGKTGWGTCYSDCECGSHSAFFCSAGPFICLPSLLANKSISLNTAVAFSGQSNSSRYEAPWTRWSDAQMTVEVPSKRGIQFVADYGISVSDYYSQMGLDVRLILDDVEVARTLGQTAATRADAKAQTFTAIAHHVSPGTHIVNIDVRSRLLSGPPAPVTLVAPAKLTATVTRYGCESNPAECTASGCSTDSDCAAGSYCITTVPGFLNTCQTGTLNAPCDAPLTTTSRGSDCDPSLTCTSAHLCKLIEQQACSDNSQCGQSSWNGRPVVDLSCKIAGTAAPNGRLFCNAGAAMCCD